MQVIMYMIVIKEKISLHKSRKIIKDDSEKKKKKKKRKEK